MTRELIPAERSRAAATVDVPGELTLRPAGPRDAAALEFFCDAMLRKDYFLRRGQLQEMLAGQRHRVFVAEIDRVLVGMAITTRGTRLVNALVHPAYRGLGIGRALVGYSGATEVRAKIDMSTGDPRPFYRALGFQSAGEAQGRPNIKIMRLPKAQPTAERRHEAPAG